MRFAEQPDSSLEYDPGQWIGEFENETRACESSTEEAIRQGVDELQEKLCASATRYYNKSFELALRNRAELDANLSLVAAERISCSTTATEPSKSFRSLRLIVGSLETFRWGRWQAWILAEPMHFPGQG